jgi:hypothetical protein
MKKYRFTITEKDPKLVDLVNKTNHKTLAIWAVDCVERILPYFEEKHPEDNRPKNVIEILRKWIKTGEFKMSEIRGASLASHSAAREVGEDNAARSAARAAGQAVATAHVRTHSIGAANYALQAIYRSASDLDAEVAVAKERNWQYQHLLELNKKN